MVARLKLAGYLDATPNKRLAPTRQFFAQPLASRRCASLPNPVEDATPDALTIGDYPSNPPDGAIRVKGVR
jgi:repressor LexA